MTRIQRLAVLILGLWLGAGVFADVAVTRNFGTVDRFLANPGTSEAANEIAALGHDRARDLLRRNAGEENNSLFTDWERTELAIGAVLIALLAFGRAGSASVALASSMFAIVAVQDFALSPAIAALGRVVPSLPAGDPAVAHFWTMHGIYSGIEILKLAIGFVLAGRLFMAAPAQSVALSPDHVVSASRNG